MKNAAVFLILILSSFPLISRANSFYQFSGVNQGPELKIFFEEVEKLLPTTLKKQFPVGIKVEFSGLLAAHGKSLIHSKSPKILLNQKLLNAIKLGEKNSPPSIDQNGNIRVHKTQYKEALATVIHETAHLYDYLNLQSEEMKKRINWCQFIPEDDEKNKQECAIYKKITTSVSTNPYYLEAAGWPMQSNGNGDRDPRNTFQFRSPDVYEMQNPVEHFAVNFEYFLLNDDFSCRRPTLARYLSRHFQHPLLSNCESNFKFVDPDAVDINHLFKEIPLDRIYQVHYLLAEPGSSMMAKFGHSMLRLVICAPGQAKGPECLTQGLPYNLVLSFRAFIDSPQINSISGLTGKYPSRLFVVPMMNVIEEYNELEYRSLKSYKLNLTESEIKQLVERALETHWSYDNQYYFTTNNCAVETLNLLKSSLLRPEIINKRALYPKELLQILKKEKLIDASALELNEELKQGLYFDSREIQHLQSFHLFFGKKVSSFELKAFFKLTTEERRALYFQRLNELPRPVTDKIVISAFQLEYFALKMKRNQFRTEVTNSIWNQEFKTNKFELPQANLNEIYQKALQAFGALSAPYQVLKFTEFGIPSQKELVDSEAEISIVRDRIKKAREIEKTISKDLENLKSYQEMLEIKKLTQELLQSAAHF